MSDFQVKSDAPGCGRDHAPDPRASARNAAPITRKPKCRSSPRSSSNSLPIPRARSDLVAQFRRHRTVSPAPPNYKFEDDTIYETHQGFLRSVRKLLNPVLKLFSTRTKSQRRCVQAKVNEEFHQRFRQREDMDPLYYELVHNLALEVTRPASRSTT